MIKFDLEFEIRIRCFQSNFVPGRIYFEIRPSLPVTTFVTNAFLTLDNDALGDDKVSSVIWMAPKWHWKSHTMQMLGKKTTFIKLFKNLKVW